MSAWQRLRRMLGASTVVQTRPPHQPNGRDRRVEAAIAKAQQALEHRARIDAEVDRVQRYLRGTP